jgi:two-component system, NtrC family, response regulator HydG
MTDNTTHKDLIVRLKECEHRCYDHERAGAALNRELEKYQKILEEIQDGYFESDINGDITFCNSAFCKILGYSREELLSPNPETFSSEDKEYVHYELPPPKHREYMSPETKKEIFLAYRNVFVTGKPNEGITHEIVRKDGTTRILENSISLKTNSQGFGTGFRSIVRDITDRKRAEKELAKQRSRLEAIFSSVKDAIITVDTDFRVIEANRATEAICGVSNKEIIGRVFTDCLRHCKRDCYDVLKEHLGKDEFKEDVRIECKRKGRFQQVVNVTVSPLRDPDGLSKGAVLVIRDITRISDLERELTERHQFHNIIGKSHRMQETYNLVEDLSDLETTVLVTGESGTGKELVAKALHYSGDRKNKPLIKVNCSALAENLLESELFGHVKGSFTGAIRDKQGRFQAADGGTIMLDEIGDISPRIQLKLLRVLQEKEFERVGESVPIQVDVRIIACTNQNLKEKVKAGEFREDLYYRLKVIEISLPSLRERAEDIPLLVDHFLEKFKKAYKRKIESVSDEVLACFMNYAWPGNVRELEHVIERAFVLCREPVIRLEHIPMDIKNPAESEQPALKQASGLMPQNILEALTKTDWNKAKAARLLGIDRGTLYRNIYKYNIKRD